MAIKIYYHLNCFYLDANGTKKNDLQLKHVKAIHLLIRHGSIHIQNMIFQINKNIFTSDNEKKKEKKKKQKNNNRTTTTTPPKHVNITLMQITILNGSKLHVSQISL